MPSPPVQDVPIWPVGPLWRTPEGELIALRRSTARCLVVHLRASGASRRDCEVEIVGIDRAKEIPPRPGRRRHPTGSRWSRRNRCPGQTGRRALEVCRRTPGGKYSVASVERGPGHPSWTRSAVMARRRWTTRHARKASRPGVDAHKMLAASRARHTTKATSSVDVAGGRLFPSRGANASHTGSSGLGPPDGLRWTCEKPPRL
jgi:hypothetical protein